MPVLQTQEYQSFESIKHGDGDDQEFWLARELAAVLGYSKWENFQNAIDRAIIACDNSKVPVQNHFADVRKTIPMPKGAQKTISDYQLSRYACYLIVQNADPRKEIIALAQTYFAIQTRRQEVADAFNQLDEDSKRLVVRGDTRKWNLLLAQAAYNAGVITQVEFAVFQNSGYRGLYGGMTASDIHERKCLKKDDEILDYMGSPELAANLFRITQTEEKLRRDEVDETQWANETHFIVGDRIRQTMKDLGSTMPEDMESPRKGIGTIEKGRLARIEALPEVMMRGE
jgi:DNA-damage-inducible protein D